MRNTLIVAILFVVLISAVDEPEPIDEFYQMNKACANSNKLDLLPHCLVQVNNIQNNKNNYECQVCEDGYYLSDKKCIKKMDGCKYQSVLNLCELCNDGYGPRYISNSRKFDGCLNTVQNCASYNAYDDCFICKDGYYLKQNKCVADAEKKRSNCYEFDYADICIRPHISYAFDVDYKIIDNKKTMCSKFDKNKYCEYCHYGYQLQSGACIYIDQNLPFNWQYVTLSMNSNNCLIMYGSLPTYLKIDEKTSGCFKNKYTEDTFKNSGCEVGKFEFIDKQLICIDCKTDDYQFQLQNDEKKAECVSKTDKQCIYYLKGVDKCQKCISGFNVYALNGPCEKAEKECEITEYKDGSKTCTPLTDVNCIQADQSVNTAKCLLCKCGYFLDNSGACTEYKSTECAYKFYVKESSDKVNNTILCYKCSTNKYLDGGICKDATDSSKCNTEQYQKFFDSKCSKIDNCAQVVTVTETKNVEKLRCKRCNPLYKLTTDSKTNDTTCDPNGDCALQFSDQTCQKCKSGQILQSGVCYEEVINCSEYSNKKCKTCKQFYQLKADKCELADLQSLTKCNKYDSNNKCLECNSLTQIVQDGKCVDKPANNCENSFQGVCIRCISNDQKHSELSSDGTCIEYQNCATNCDENKCKAPLYGFKKGTCINSIGKVPLCLQYVQPDVNKQDIVCESCREGYIVTADKSLCIKSSISNCQYLTNDSDQNKQTCSQCIKSYELSEDKSTCTEMKTDATSSSLIVQAYQSMLILIVIFIALL